MEKKTLVHYIMPSFIFFYFALAVSPIITHQKTEIFPFFSFKLYSKIPNGFAKYDILFNRGCNNEHYLLYQNHVLNKLEINSFNKKLTQISTEYNLSGKIDLKNFAYILEKGETAFLVKLSGSYVEAVREQKFHIEFLEKLK